MVPFLKRLWYDAVLDWGLNPRPPALEASTLPLGYRGGGPAVSETKNAHLCRNKLNLKYCAIINDRRYE